MSAAKPPRRGWILLATVVGVGVTASLGFWQLDRVDQKQAIEKRLRERAELAPLDNTSLRWGEPFWQRRVSLQGHWLNDKTLFLDNRPMNGRVGFFVVTPLRLAGREGLVLVQRGWVPRDQRDRNLLPELPASTATVTVSGRLIEAPSRVYQLGGGDGGRIRQNLDPAAYGLELGQPVLPLAVLQTAAADNDAPLLRDWPAPAVDVQRNYGYAFQWFALCALLLGLYVWFQVIQPRRHR
ncbi:SURF1 family protein [Paucibacter sp. APW11]|uniref:SURF1-like protein n=1 Tax=Roseateles aquae TaxID=3077235 RepID=A0ABU3PF32_9BURK|nr:SURF1 family protein [Paucibacter sp. APW11]MDT9001215.1 SURF1 family protein [Paucibacter sp. APW11]